MLINLNNALKNISKNFNKVNFSRNLFVLKNVLFIGDNNRDY
jgi:hypothetical protein